MLPRELNISNKLIRVMNWDVESWQNHILSDTNTARNSLKLSKSPIFNLIEETNKFMALYE